MKRQIDRLRKTHSDCNACNSRAGLRFWLGGVNHGKDNWHAREHLVAKALRELNRLS